MATVTISSDTFWDSGTTRQPGVTDTYNINGATLTIRTDTRHHAGAPAARTGSIGHMTISATEGGALVIDARNTLWIKYSGGTGVVPAFNSTITFAHVDSEFPEFDWSYTGYVLGVWSSMLAAPLAPAAAMPATGYLKIRGTDTTIPTYIVSAAYGTVTDPSTLVTGNILTGISNVRRGWIEVLADGGAAALATTITVPRKGQFRTYGDWFYLQDTAGNDTTSGVRAQQFQTPVLGVGTEVTNTESAGAWVETGNGTNLYEYWPSLEAASLWNAANMGEAVGETDKRQQFLFNPASSAGVFQFGQDITVETGSAYNHAAITAPSAFVRTRVAMSYTWANDTITVSGATHGVIEGQAISLTFNTGGATGISGRYLVTHRVSTTVFEVRVVGSGASGSVSMDRCLITWAAAHGLVAGDKIWINFPSGMTSGAFLVESIPSTTTLVVVQAGATASGTTGCTVFRYTVITTTVTSASWGAAVGRRVTVTPTTGLVPAGNYEIAAVGTNTISIWTQYSAATSGVCNLTLQIGRVPVSGCRVRIPNILMRECLAAARATNTVPNATKSSRPRFVVTQGGDLDIQYTSGGWAYYFTQAYNVVMKHNSCFDQVTVSENGNILDIDDLGISWSLATIPTTAGNDPLYLASNFSGLSTVKNVVLPFPSAATAFNALNVTSCIGMVFENILIVTNIYVRAATARLSVLTSSEITFTDCTVINGNIGVTSCIDITFTRTRYIDRVIGNTSSNVAQYMFVVVTKCARILIDGVLLGYTGATTESQPYNGILAVSNCDDVTIRNCGTFAAPLVLGTAARAYARCALFSTTSIGTGYGNNKGLRFQRCYGKGLRAVFSTPLNADYSVSWDNCAFWETMVTTAGILFSPAECDAIYRGLMATHYGSIAAYATAVYGTHFTDFFTTSLRGEVRWSLNEPTAETLSQTSRLFTGRSGFTSYGSLNLVTVGDYFICETPYFVLGHTGLTSVAYVATNPTYLTYTYWIDTGSGWSAEKALSNANLLAETISPSTGFKLKIKAVCNTAAVANSLSFVTIATTTTPAAQAANLHPLDTASLNFAGVSPGSDIVVTSGYTEQLGIAPHFTADAIAGTTATWTYDSSLIEMVLDIGPESGGYFNIRVFKDGKVPYVIYGITDLPLTGSATFQIAQVNDRAFIL